MRLATLTLVLLLSGCGSITWPAALTIGGAVLGFGAKAIDLDKAIIGPACPVPQRAGPTAPPADDEPEDQPRVIEI